MIFHTFPFLNRFRNRFKKTEIKYAVFYAALIVKNHIDPMIFGGYFSSIDIARDYVKNKYPDYEYVCYEKVILDGEPSVLEIKKLPVTVA